MRYTPVPLCLALAACGQSAPPAPREQQSAPAPKSVAAPAPLDPPQPGEPGGLPDDRTPVSEAPYSATSAQGAANVVQTWAALVESKRATEARALWSGDPASFEQQLAATSEWHAMVGAPGRVEGAAGSLYVEVPVQAYGRLRDGSTFNEVGTATLRRVNDVPGSTTGQRKWHIATVELKAAP